MTTRVEADEIHITRSEKALAVVLAIFMLIGGLWLYFEPLDRVEGFDSYQPVAQTAREAGATSKREDAVAALRRARLAENAARRNLEVRREAYRTELDAGRSGASSETAFRRAERDFVEAERRTRRSAVMATRTRPPAERAQRNLAARQQAADSRAADQRDDRELITFFLRLAWVILVMAGGFLLQDRLRQRRSRYLTVGLAFVGFATAQALVMAVDYTTDYIDVGEVGPAVLSATGIAMSLGAMVVLQRNLAKRLPARRVKRRECPVCAYPVTNNRFCEGCGREVLAECSACGRERRVGTARCGACGAA